MYEFSKADGIDINIIMIHAQLIELYCSIIGFIYVGLRFNEFFFKLIVDGVG